MFIKELNEAECCEVLGRTGFGRLACAKDNKPYVIPFFFAYSNYSVYAFSTPGFKIDCMRGNPHVCVQTDEIRSQSCWKSVVARGEYEELPDTPAWESERKNAWGLFQQTPNWWQPGSCKPYDDNSATIKPIWYRINLTEITGRKMDESTGMPFSSESFVRPSAKKSMPNLI